MTVVINGTTGIAVGAAAAPAFSAYQSSAQTLSSNTATKLQFQTEEFDTNSNFDNATNYRFTPTVAGYYQVNASLEIGVAQTGAFMAIYKNGSEYKRGSNINANQCYGAIVSCIVYLNGSTDYIEAYGFITNGQVLAAGIQQTYFQASMIRSA